MLLPSESAPELFSDPLMNRSNYWALSTSAIHHPNFEVYGWGEVVPDGFGVAYVAGQDSASSSLFRSFLLLSFSEYGASEADDDKLTIERETHTDFLQFTLTSRTEMPNAQFSAELNRASEDMLAIFTGEAKAKL